MRDYLAVLSVLWSNPILTPRLTPTCYRLWGPSKAKSVEYVHDLTP